MDKTLNMIICLSFGKGKEHDFNIFKRSKLRFHRNIPLLLDTGYTGISKYHKNSILPIKRVKRKPVSKKDKQFNRTVSSLRVSNEHAIGFVKRFKILSERYRNRRKRFTLRFNLIAGIANFDIHV